MFFFLYLKWIASKRNYLDTLGSKIEKRTDEYVICVSIAVSVPRYSIRALVLSVGFVSFENGTRSESKSELSTVICLFSPVTFFYVISRSVSALLLEGGRCNRERLMHAPLELVSLQHL